MSTMTTTKSEWVVTDRCILWHFEIRSNRRWFVSILDWLSIESRTLCDSIQKRKKKKKNEHTCVKNNRFAITVLERYSFFIFAKKSAFLRCRLHFIFIFYFFFSMVHKIIFNIPLRFPSHLYFRQHHIFCVAVFFLWTLCFQPLGTKLIRDMFTFFIENSKERKSFYIFLCFAYFWWVLLSLAARHLDAYDGYCFFFGFIFCCIASVNQMRSICFSFLSFSHLR